MEKRGKPRFKRRVPLEFWSLGDKGKPRRGFTVNVSESGLFIATNRPLSVGSLIAIELAQAEQTAPFEGEVRSAVRVDPALRRLKQSGMGVRLLTTEEKMRAVIRTGATKGSPSQGTRAEAGSKPEERSLESSPLFSVYLDSPEQLSEMFDSHIKHGGVFVPTTTAADVEEQIHLEFLFSWTPETMFQTTGQVVKTFHTSAGNGSVGDVTGLGVAFSDPQGTINEFRQLLELSA